MDNNNYDQIIIIKKIINDVTKKTNISINKEDLFHKLIKTWLQPLLLQKGIVYFIYTYFVNTHNLSVKDKNTLASIIIKSVEKYGMNNIYKHFENFLRNKNVWDIFWQNRTMFDSTTSQDETYCRIPINTIISTSFHWVKTPQGEVFWRNQHVVWYKYCTKLLSPTQNMKELALEVIKQKI